METIENRAPERICIKDLTIPASMSITNVVSALKIANGSSPAINKFVRPTEDDDFRKPWRYSPGVTVCSLDFVIDESKVIPTTRKELLDRLKELRRT